jgi:hypothetical protein
MISVLPSFCAKIKLPSDFAANWFYELAERVKNDLAGGGVYEGIENYALAFPSNALEVFNNYERKLEDETIMRLASLILGCVRCHRKNIVQKIDSYLKSSNDVKKKMCYYDSIFISYKNGAITLKQLSVLLDQMLKEESREINDIAFSTVRKGLITNTQEFERFGISWFDKNCSQSISGNSKFHVISCMWLICSDRKKRPTIDHRDANRIIAKILPVPNEHLGTLDEFSNYLCYGIKGVDEFTEAIMAFIPNGTDNILCMFVHDKFEHFRHELKNLDLTRLATELIFSGDFRKSKLGFLFLEYSKITPHTIKTLKKVKTENLFVALKQLNRDRNLNENIAKKILFLEPFYRKANKEVQDEFIDEIVVQAVNYSQGCLKEIKQFGRRRLIKEVIARAEKYFENFKTLRKSPANGFSFPGYREACWRASKRFNALIKKHAEEKSIFMSLVSKVQLIYGHDFSFSIGESISDASPMTHFEKAMELPRLEIIDPEGMTIRRISED